MILDKSFCEFLEYEITNALNSSSDDRLRGFWCDGVLLLQDENEYSKKSVNDTRRIIMKAFSGQTGQDKYELTLRFGSKALSRYARDLRIEDCVRNLNDDNWLHIDPVNKAMVIQLD